MQKKIINYLAVCLYIILSVSISASQVEDFGEECGIATSTCNSQLRNIPSKTPGSSDFLRCLVVYITFPDDTLSGYEYTIWKNRFQTTNPRPVNPYFGANGHLIDSLVGNNSTPFMTRYHDHTISDFFCEMSMGTYDVIGDEIALTLPKNMRYYHDTLGIYEYSKFNRYIL